LVYRSPLQQLSDIQKFTAVSCPALTYLTDVIVFSTQGKQSPASLLSGGDYDGDQAWVIWHPDFVQHVTPVVFQREEEAQEDKAKKNEKKKEKVSCMKQQPIQWLTEILDIPDGDPKQDLVAQALYKYGCDQDAYYWLRRLSSLLRQYRETSCMSYLSKGEQNPRCPRPQENGMITRLALFCALVVDAPKSGQIVDAAPMRTYLRIAEQCVIRLTRDVDSLDTLLYPSRLSAPDRFHQNEPHPTGYEGDKDPDLCITWTDEEQSQWSKSAETLLKGLEFMARQKAHSGHQLYQAECLQVLSQADDLSMDGEEARAPAPTAEEEEAPTMGQAKRLAKLRWIALRERVRKEHTWPTRVRYASFVYQMACERAQQQSDHLGKPTPYEATYELWFLFLHEFCRLKADAVSLRENNSLACNVLPKFHALLHFTRN